MEDTLIVLGFLFTGWLVWFLRRTYAARRTEAEHRLVLRRTRQLQEAFGPGSEGFTASHQFAEYFPDCAVAVDEKRRLVCLAGARPGRPFQRLIYPHTRLIDVALVEDGATVTETTTDRGNLFKGALLGRLIYGRFGALLGGLSAKRVGTSTEISRGIELRITVDDLSHPVWTVPFFRGNLPRSSTRYRNIFDQALQWKGLFGILIHHADHERTASFSSPPPLRAEVIASAPSALSPATPLPLPVAAVVAVPVSSPNTVPDTYQLRHAGKDIGAMPLPRIRLLLTAGRLSAQNDAYYDPQLEEWMPLELLPA